MVGVYIFLGRNNLLFGLEIMICLLFLGLGFLILIMFFLLFMVKLIILGWELLGIMVGCFFFLVFFVF